jgi:hypothetical protein
MTLPIIVKRVKMQVSSELRAIEFDPELSRQCIVLAAGLDSIVAGIT